MSLPPLESIPVNVAPTEDDLVRVGLTAAGVAACHGADSGAPAVFFVETAGNVFLRVRAAGNAAHELLSSLERGDRVEIRLAPLVDLKAERPATEAGQRAGWGSKPSERGEGFGGGGAWFDP